MGRRQLKVAGRPHLLPGSHFHACRHSSAQLVAAVRELSDLLRTASDEGIRERPLLDWFGASTERMALFAHAGGQVNPTYVARELVLGDMRADFGLLSVPTNTDVAPRLLLVECQGARANTLFESGHRTLLYWGADFLEGFGQLVDWDCFGAPAVRNQKVASLISHCRQPLQVFYLLVAGLRKFSMDALSEQRLAFWADTLPLGSNFQIRRFDDVAHDARHWVEQTLWKEPTVRGIDIARSVPVRMPIPRSRRSPDIEELRRKP